MRTKSLKEFPTFVVSFGEGLVSLAGLYLEMDQGG